MPAQPKWVISEPDPTNLRTIAETPASSSLSPLVQRLLCLRGHSDPDAIERFLFPKLQDLSDPFRLPEMDKAVERILAAVDSAEPVAIYGDYDVDGVTSLTLFKHILKAYGVEPHLFLPHRTEEGYGLSRAGLDRCLEEHSPALLIAVDCGTSSAAEVARLQNDLGIAVIIVDHHECPPDARPLCSALVNPKASADGSPTGYEYLCSAGLVFKVAHALLKKRPVPGFDLRRYIDIAALGTVADIVPLVDENRLIVRKGLSQLERTDHPGLRELKRVASVNGRVQASDVGFRLGPRLNAAGRVDTAQTSLDLLLADCEDEARQLAQTLDLHNRERQALERRTYTEAVELLERDHDTSNDPCFIIGSDKWHPGVVGIVASRLMRAYHRPTFVVAINEDGNGKGSGRSVPGISLIEAINACSDLLINGGGHEMAAGISLPQENITAFRSAFIDCVRNAAANTESLTQTLNIDASTELAELTLDMLDSYELLQPFGSANPEPIFMVSGVTVANEPRVLKDRHLKLRLKQGSEVRDAIYFGGAEQDLPRFPWDVAFQISRNTFRGNHSIQLTVQAIRATPES